MQELEFFNTWTSSVALTETYNDRFQTLLFAFLIASYLVASKIARFVAAIVVSLYSLMVFRYGLVYFNASGDLVEMAAVLRGYAALPDSTLSWLEIGPIGLNYMGVLVMYALSYLASIVFFFYIRNRGPAIDV